LRLPSDLPEFAVQEFCRNVIRYSRDEGQFGRYSLVRTSNTKVARSRRISQSMIHGDLQNKTLQELNLRKLAEVSVQFLINLAVI